MIRWAAVILITLYTSLSAYAQENDSGKAPTQAMSLERMQEILTALDPEAQTNESRFALTIEGVRMLVITDTHSDRMRVMAPIREYQGISAAEMTRMMQANFDSALDARYAIAQGMLWSAYIHPFSLLQKNQLISGIGQVVNLALTYGTIYSGGALNYGGGDSGSINRELIEKLLEKGEEV